MAVPSVVEWSQSAPPQQQRGTIDPIVNLLVTTLSAVVVIALPLVAGRLSDSAPAVKAPVQLDTFVERPQLTLGINPNAFIQRLDAAAPPPKYQVQVDTFVQRPLALGINPSAFIQRLDAGAPITKYAIQVDSFVQWPLTLGINPNAFIQRLDQSAPITKYQVQLDSFVQRPELTLGINPSAFIQRLDTGSPFPKYQIQLDFYPNLTLSTLAPAAVALPVGKPVDTSQLQLKYNIQLEPVPYPFTLGIPATVIVAATLPVSQACGS